jgi:hypothetical protein
MMAKLALSGKKGKTSSRGCPAHSAIPVDTGKKSLFVGNIYSCAWSRWQEFSAVRRDSF